MALGYPAPGKPINAPPVSSGRRCFWMLPLCWETKHKAMESMEAQPHLWEYYTGLGKRRYGQAVRNGGAKGIRYGEAFQRVYPQVTDKLL